MNISQYAGQIGRLAYPDKVGHPWGYFEMRGCFLDCRGPLVISDRSVWGFQVHVYTQSHEISEGQIGPTRDYGVTVEEGAWIGSNSVLTGCTIGKGSIVACGTVVRGQTVGPGVMVAGNPARVIARWDGGRWIYEDEELSGYERMLV